LAPGNKSEKNDGDAGITLILEPHIFQEYIFNSRIAESHGKSTAFKRKKIDKWDFITLRVFCTTKETRHKKA
jgi:hypothetical protein